MIEQEPQAEHNKELYRRWRDARANWDNDARKDLDFSLGNHFSAEEEEDVRWDA